MDQPRSKESSSSVSHWMLSPDAIPPKTRYCEHDQRHIYKYMFSTGSCRNAVMESDRIVKSQGTGDGRSNVAAELGVRSVGAWGSCPRDHRGLAGFA